MLHGFMKKINPVKKRDNLQLEVDSEGPTSKQEPNSAKIKKSFDFPGSDAKGTYDKSRLEESVEQGDFTMKLNFLKSKQNNPGSLPVDNPASFEQAPSSSSIHHKPSQNFFLSSEALQRLDELDQAGKIKAIKLPKFLITREEFDSFIDPPLRHLNYN